MNQQARRKYNRETQRRYWANPARTPAQREARRNWAAKHHAKLRAWYLAQPAEYRDRFTQLGSPRREVGRLTELTRFIRETTKYRNLVQVRSAVQRGEITWGSLPPRLQQKISRGTGTGTGIDHKKQYGESLEQMGRRLGISREAVRTRLTRWGSPEHRPPCEGPRTNAVTPDFISAHMLRVWGYDSIAQLAQLSDSELLELWSFGPHRLARLRQLYPAHTAEAAR